MKTFFIRNSNVILGLAIVLASFVYTNVAYANMNVYEPGENITIGEFVFDDDGIATTSDCYITIYNSAHSAIAPNITMTDTANGWHYYSTSTIVIEGLYPTIMTCGSIPAGDLASIDKTFAIRSISATTTDIITASVWNSSASSSIATVINDHTDNAILTASTSLAITINSHTDATVLTASSSLFATIPLEVWSNNTKSLTNFGSLAADVWSVATSTFTTPGTAGKHLSDTVAYVWSFGSRNLTDSTLNTGSLATLSDVQNASTSLGSNISGLATNVNTHTDSQFASAISTINAHTDATVLTASSSLFATIPTAVWGNANTRTLSNFGTLAASVWEVASSTLTTPGTIGKQLATRSGLTVTMSDFGGTTVNTAYKARLQILNHGIPVDADSLPTVAIIDSAGTIKEPSGVMTKDSNGTYSYSYTITGSQVGGVWETVVSVVIGGETVKVNDYWTLSSSPADVQIIEITDKTVSTITANVKIDNKGTSGSDFYYVYCVVNSANGLCGDNDIDSGSDTAYIGAGDYINLSLTLDDVSTLGTYWYKVKARALGESNWAASSEQFIAESSVVVPSVAPPVTSSGGGGGGGGAPSAPSLVVPGTHKKSDFNRDGKVNSIDFSILMYFWKSKSPFKNTYVDINKDAKIDSIDFSILLYEWDKK